MTGNSSLKAAAVVVLAALTCSAQTAPQPAERHVEVHNDVFVAGTPVAGAAFGHAVEFISSVGHFDNKMVKGAPYSAQAVTETAQTLTDGNRIRRSSTATIYRDSEGRTRREQTLAALGPWASAEGPIQQIFINDPVAGVSYHLHPRDKTAVKLPSGAGEKMFEIAVPPLAAISRASEANVRMFNRRGGPPLAAGAVAMSAPDTKSEPLGKRNIEGVEAEGTRSTFTIPAGAIGNDLPINIVSERWYSPELQTVVMSTRNDPQHGETTYRLTNIVRADPSRALFEVPSDYTIKDAAVKIREERHER